MKLGDLNKIYSKEVFRSENWCIMEERIRGYSSQYRLYPVFRVFGFSFRGFLHQASIDLQTLKNFIGRWEQDC